MPPLPLPDFSLLNAAGLNRIAILNPRHADLPALDFPVEDDSRLLLIGHAGRQLWTALHAQSERHPQDPIDHFTLTTLSQWFAEELPGVRYHVLYPGPTPIGLQRLGQLAGWHHASPFMIGVDARWGSWFAYRAAILCAAPLPLTPVDTLPSPCLSCRDAPCRQACPAQACADTFRLDACSRTRLQADSPCQTTCLARLACPIAPEHRYDDAQLHHSYVRSLAYLRAWQNG